LRLFPTATVFYRATHVNSSSCDPSQSYGASPAIWDQTVSPATRQMWTRRALTPANRPVLDLPTPEGWEAELTLVLVIYRYGLPVRRQSPILVVTTLWQPDRESNPRPLDPKFSV